ncbi:MAG: FixH family protein [Pseudomonadota bacterium]
MSSLDMEEGQTKVRPVTGRTVLLYLMAFFGVMLIANGFFVYFALSTFSGLDNPSSYKAGRNYTSQIEAAQAQAIRAWTVKADIARSGAGANIELLATDHADAPVRGVDFAVHLGHPADRRHDFSVPLAVSDLGHFRGRAETLAEGWWTVTIIGTRDGETVYKSTERLRIR